MPLIKIYKINITIIQQGLVVIRAVLRMFFEFTGTLKNMPTN